MPVELGARVCVRRSAVWANATRYAVELLTTRASMRGVCEHGRDRAAVLAQQPLGRGEALFDLIERAILTGEAFAVVAQLRREISRLEHDAPQTLGERIQMRDRRPPPRPAGRPPRQQRHGARVLR